MRAILVVDDERDLAVTCARLLSRRGWRVMTTGTREEALAALIGDPRPSLAIVDRQLPDGDGLDVLRAARAAGTPVIMVTAYGSAATRRLALDEGAAGFLAKPFSSHDLLALVHNLVGDASGSKAGPPGPSPTGIPPHPGIHF